MPVSLEAEQYVFGFRLPVGAVQGSNAARGRFTEICGTGSWSRRAMCMCRDRFGSRRQSDSDFYHFAELMPNPPPAGRPQQSHPGVPIPFCATAPGTPARAFPSPLRIQVGLRSDHSAAGPLAETGGRFCRVDVSPGMPGRSRRMAGFRSSSECGASR